MKLAFFLSALLVYGQMTEPTFIGRHVTAGKIIGAPVFGPGDLVFAVSEDQRLHYLTADGKVQTRFSLGTRFAFGPVHGTGQWLIVVTRDRRIHRLDYTRPSASGNPGQISLTWSATFSDDPAGPPALLPGGRVAIGYLNGSLRVWEPDGALAWSHQDNQTGTAAPMAADPAGRIWWAHGRRLSVWDARGRVEGTTGLPEDIARMVLDTHGRTWMLSVTGRVFRVNRPGGSLVPLNHRGVVDLLAPEDGGLWMVFSRAIRRHDINTRQTSELLSPSPLSFGAVLTSDDALAIPQTSGGLWFSDGTNGDMPRDLPVLENVSLSETGLLVAAGEDWNLYLARFRPPPRLGWHQSSGSSEGGFKVRRLLEASSQRARWEGFNGFRIARILLNRGTRDDHERVLVNLEEASKAGQLDTIPYAQGLLIEICQSGIERLQMENFELRNNWPDLRLRAVTLLREIADFSSRESLLLLLRKEHDESVRIAMIQLLSRLGWDEDGKAAAAISDILQAGSTPGLGLAAVAYLESLKNSGSLPATSQHARLVRLLVSSNYPRETRTRAWNILNNR